MTRIRIGVAGLGAVAQSVHLPLLQRRWDLFELAAVADLSLSSVNAVGEQFGVDAAHRYASLTDMLDAEQLDGVLLLTSGSHGGPALECMRRGIAVFCEKPLAYSLDEIDRLLAAEKTAGRPLLLLGYMKEYDPAVLALRELLPEPSAIRYVNVEVLHPSPQAQLAYANLRPPARDIDPAALAEGQASSLRALTAALGPDVPRGFSDLYANVILGSLIHDISLVRSLMGSIKDIDDVTLWAEQDQPGSLEVSGTISEQARFHLHWHYLAQYPRYRETVTIHHTTGTLELEFSVPYLLNAPTELRVTSARGTGESVDVIRNVTEAFEQELLAFHQMVAAQIVPCTGAIQGRADVVTGQRITRVLAAKQGIALSGETAQQ
ncbi:MAG TPA: Gfo/Idh/MocA family oxidoreductase [Propionibacteriaceae bacterium]